MFDPTFRYEDRQWKMFTLLNRYLVIYPPLKIHSYIFVAMLFAVSTNVYGKASTLNAPNPVDESRSQLKSRVVVDTAMTPSTDIIVGKDNVIKPIAKLETESGITFEFVENEVCLLSGDKTEVDAFVERWDGTIESVAQPSRANKNDPAVYTIRINTSLAHKERAAHYIQRINNKFGKLKVSSPKAKELIAIIAEETAEHKLKIGLSIGFFITLPDNSITVLGLKQLTGQLRQ